MIPELRTFVAIARYGTFSAAADQVGLTQAAVSGHIKRLEDHLGFALFERHGRRARLSAAGHRTLDRARDVIGRFEALAAPEEEASDEVLKIGAIASVQPSLLAGALARFYGEYPQTRILVTPGVSLHLIEEVYAGELDLAILIKPAIGLPVDLDWLPLRTERYVLIAPQACEGQGWREILKSMPFLGYDRLAVGGRQVDRFVRTLPFRVSPAMEVPIQSMIRMVGHGLGVALVPWTDAHLPLPEGVCVVELEGESLAREIGMTCSRSRFDDPAIRYLAESLMRHESA
jgi:DNA-binding transcriptional LysR family regulator